VVRPSAADAPAAAADVLAAVVHADMPLMLLRMLMAASLLP
jgi:hypothetical protein